MAISAAICSSSPLPTIPSLKTHQQQYQPIHRSPPPNQASSSSSSSGKFGSSLVSGDSVSFATAAAALERVCHGDGTEKRRNKRRRRRRRGFEGLEMEMDENGEEEGYEVFFDSESGYLSPKGEAELCRCLREGAKLEAAGRRDTEAHYHETDSKYVFKNFWIKRNIDKILCRRIEAREKLTRIYRRLVVSVASGYQGKGLSLQDLIQEGSIGLLRGAEKFDPERGYKLSTYVYWWIKQAITRAVANKCRLVRLPGSMFELMAKVAEAIKILSTRLRRMPTCDEIAEELNLHVSKVRLVLVQSRSPLSLDQTAATDQGHMTLQEIMQGPEEKTPEFMVKRQNMKQEIKKLLESLTIRESRVLKLRFGLNGETPLSFEEIGKLLKLSRERVRQINGIALTKLQKMHNADDLKLYIV